MILQWIFFLLAVYIVCRLVLRKLAQPDYRGKNVWITGASSGIGQALAYQFNSKGARVIISARNLTQLQRVQNSCQYPQNVQILKMDMVQYKQVTRLTVKLLEDLKKQNQKLDVVVQNAGVSMRCLLKDLPFQNHQNIMNINLHGPFNHLQPIVKHMIDFKSGHIVGITSVAAKLPTAYRSSYACSKNAFIGFLDTLRTQVQPFGISVTNIMPGYIKTNLPFNAMGSEAGKTFNSSDKNIQNGMDAKQFAKQAVKAIYNKQTDCHISNNWIQIPFAITLKTVIPDLGFLFLKKNAQNQKKAFVKQKNQ